jgi:hypothetical protein
MAQHITGPTGSAQPTAAGRASQSAILRAAIVAASAILSVLEEMAEIGGVGPDHDINRQIEEARRDLAEMRIALAMLEAQCVRLN